MATKYEIDAIRTGFEEACLHAVATLTGWEDIRNGYAWEFDYINTEYENAYTNACWLSYTQGRDTV